MVLTITFIPSNDIFSVTITVEKIAFTVQITKMSTAATTTFVEVREVSEWMTAYTQNEKTIEIAEEELIVAEPSKEEVKAQKVDSENEGKESTNKAAEVDTIDVDVETKPVK